MVRERETRSWYLRGVTSQLIIKEVAPRGRSQTSAKGRFIEKVRGERRRKRGIRRRREEV